MDVSIKHQPAFALATVKLAPSETVKVEPGAMVGHSQGVTVETKSEGGLFGGLKRMVGGESFFQNTYTAPANGGEILLQSGGYVASEDGVSFDSKWGGAKGFFGGMSLVLLRVSGQGKVLIASYGALEERVLGQGEVFTVDTGHIVAFEASVGFQVRRVGGWKSTFLSGEGLVVDLTGPGRVLMQTRSEEAFIGWLTPRLPKSSN